MSKLFNVMMPLYAPDNTSGSGGAPSGEGTKILPSGDSREEMIEFLAGDDEQQETIDLEEEGKGKEKGKDKTPPKGKEKDTDESETPDEDETGDEDEEVDELAEIEDELEEPSEEQLELVTPVRRREILKKYPNLFKEFPYLEKAYYREQQFTELLPTIDDAKAAVEKSQILDRFEGDLMSGNAETVLKAVQASNPKAFLKIVDDYLPTLAKVDEKAYFHVLGNVTKH